jgi:plasmid stabilization system protein ParE
MKYQVVVTDRAVRDIDEAYSWYSERAPQAAVRWYNGLLETLESLSTYPERCSIAAESRKVIEEIRQMLYGKQRNHRVLYVIRDRTVVVLHIRHAARRTANTEELF